MSWYYAHPGSVTLTKRYCSQDQTLEETQVKVEYMTRRLEDSKKSVSPAPLHNGLNDGLMLVHHRSTWYLISRRDSSELPHWNKRQERKRTDYMPS